MDFQQISARQIAVSGLRAQRTRMNVIANNMANAFTTRTPDGGPFRRQLAVFEGQMFGPGAREDRMGVRVKGMTTDNSPLREVYQPDHPDANADGFVSYPNVTMAAEMVDLISAQRAYEANIAVLASGSAMSQRALQLLDG